MPPAAYIVCGDGGFDNHRVYKVDLVAGGMLGVSLPIDWLGNPTHLAFDMERSRLYIGSFRGKAYDYYPITVVNVQDGEFEVVGRYTTNPDDVLPRDSTRWNKKPYEVYQIAVSPDGTELYLAHGGLSEGMLGAAWDANTGTGLRELERSVRQTDVWSPDGRYFARILPDRDRTREADGKIPVEKIPARVEVFDVRTGRRVSLMYPEDGKGLHPPWGRTQGPFVRAHGSGRILVHDRDTGEVLSDFSVDQLTGLSSFGGVTWAEQPLLHDRRTIVLGMRDVEAESTFVVAINAIGKAEVTRTEAGANCTNPVLANVADKS